MEGWGDEGASEEAMRTSPQVKQGLDLGSGSRQGMPTELKNVENVTDKAGCSRFNILLPRQSLFVNIARQQK